MTESCTREPGDREVVVVNDGPLLGHRWYVRAGGEWWLVVPTGHVRPWAKIAAGSQHLVPCRGVHHGLDDRVHVEQQWRQVGPDGTCSVWFTGEVFRPPAGWHVERRTVTTITSPITDEPSTVEGNP